MMMRNSSWAPALLLVGLGVGSVACVGQADYDAALAESTRLRDQLQVATAAAADDAKTHEVALARVQDELARVEALAAVRAGELEKASAARGELMKKLDDMIALNAELEGALESLGKDVDKLLSNNVKLGAALVTSKARLALLRSAQAAAERRARLFKDLATRLHKMIDSGELSVVLREGRMVLQLRNDVLFDSGKTDIKPKGKEALEAVAQILVKLDGRRFQVSGHTDNVPIHSSRFRTNWELSAGRAIAVVNLLLDQKLDPQRISAAAYGEFDPVAKNDSDEGKAQNRRIEITLVPNIDELVQVPGEAG